MLSWRSRASSRPSASLGAQSDPLPTDPPGAAPPSRRREPTAGARLRHPAVAGVLASVLLGFAALLAVPQTAHAQASPEISSVAITSAPGTDETYARYFTLVVNPDIVEVTVTFDGAVDITGTPQLELDFAGAAKAADCAAHGTDTTKLVCSYTVAENDSAPDGIAIAANKLTLNGGTIKRSGSTTVDAVLTHDAVAIDAGHKVDGIRPTLVTTGDDAPKTSEDGTKVILTFSEDIATSEIGKLSLEVDSVDQYESGATVTISGNTVTLTLLSSFTIEHGKAVVVSVLLGGVLDRAGNRNPTVRDQTVTNNVPAPAAAITGVAITSDPGMDGNYATGDNIEVTATFDNAVTVTGRPRILLKLETATRGDRWAEYASGSGSTGIVFAYEVLATDESDTNGIEVGVVGAPNNTVALNGGTVTEVVTGEDAALGHDPLLSNSGHRVNWARPALSSAETSTDGTKVLLTFSEPLLSLPNTSSFTVKVDDTAVTLSGTTAAVSGSVVTLTLTTALTSATQAVTVSYTDPTTGDDRGNVVHDLAGNDANSFTDQAVTNKLDVVKPTLSSAEASSDLTKIVLTFSEALTETPLPATGDFTLNVDSGTAPTIDSVAIDGRDVTLSLSAAVDTSKTYTIDYTAGTNPIKDLVGNAVEDFSGQSVTLVDTTAPTFVSAETYAIDGTGTGIALQFNETIASTSIPTTSAFAVKIGGTGVTVASVAHDSTDTDTVNLVLGTNPKAGEAVTVSYTLPGSNPLEDGAGNDVASFTDEAVTNNASAPGKPTVTVAAKDASLEVTVAFTAHGTHNITKYQYQVKTTGSFGAWTDSTENVSNTGGTFTIGSLTNGTAHTVKVRGVSAAGDGAESDEASGTPEAAPAVDSIGFSSAGNDNTFVIGDAVTATVTFTESVTVDTTGGTPQLTIKMGGADKVLDYSSGSPGTMLVFSGYTVAANDEDTDGLSIEANKLDANSGTIKSTADATEDAVLTHSAEAASVNHKVDGIRPTLVTTGDDAPRTSNDGTQVILTFSEDISAFSLGVIDLKVGAFAGQTAGATVSLSGRTVTITLVSAATIEAGETVALTLSANAATDAAGNRNLAVTGTIAVINAVGVAVSFGAAALSVVEGGSATVTLTLGEASGTTVTVPIVATPGTELNSNEYSGVPMNVVFNAGDTSKSFTVMAVDDDDDEPDRLLTFSFGTPLPEGYVPGTNSQLVLTIADNDVPIVSATFDAATAEVQEGTSRRVTVSLGQVAPEREVVLPIRATPGAGLGSSEYEGVPADVTFAADATEAVFTVTFVDDAVVEGNETLTLTFGTYPDRVRAGANTRLVLTVTDDDGPPAAPDVTVQTGDGYAALSWQPVANDSPVLRYEVRWRESDGGTFNAWQRVGLVTSYRVEGLTNDKAHEFEVRAVNLHGDGEEVSAPGTPTERLTGIPKAPQWLRFADVTDSSRAELKWGSPSNGTDRVTANSASATFSQIQGYRIEVCRTTCGDEANWYAVVPNTRAFVHKYVHQVLAPGVIRENRYRVQAININGKTGPWSNVATLDPTRLERFWLVSPNSSTVDVHLEVWNPDGNPLYVRYTGGGEVRYAQQRLTKKGFPVIGLPVEASTHYRVEVDFVDTFDSPRLQSATVWSLQEGADPYTSPYAKDLLDAEVWRGGQWREAPDNELYLRMGETGKYRVRLKPCGSIYSVIPRRIQAPAGRLRASPTDFEPSLFSNLNCKVVQDGWRTDENGDYVLMKDVYDMTNFQDRANDRIPVHAGAPNVWHEVTVTARALEDYDADVRADALLSAPFAVVYNHEVYYGSEDPRSGLVSEGTGLVRISLDRPEGATLPVPTGVTIASDTRVMSWDAVPGASHYLVEWRYGPRYSNRANTDRSHVSATSKTLPLGGSGRGPITARVRAYSSSAVSAWSAELTWDSRPPTLSVLDTAVNEDDGSVGFLVTLNPAATGTVTVDYATADGTAVAGTDYTATSGTLTFAPGEREKKTALVPIADDDEEDSGETFRLVLSNPTGSDANNGRAVLGDAEAVATILNSEQEPAPLTGFTLVDAGTNDDLMLLADGVTVRLGELLAASYGIRAEMSPGAAPGSVRLELSGAKTVTNTDDASPWSLYGDGAGRLNGGSLPPGSYALTATAYANSGGQGDEQGSLEVSFTVAAGALGVTTPRPFTVAEGTTDVTTLAASDTGTGGTASWSIPAGTAGGADGTAFALTPEGVLSLVAAKDFEAPDDADGDGTYEVTVEVREGAQSATAALSVTLSDVDEAVLAVTTPGPFAVAEGTTAVAELAASGTGTGATSWSIPEGTAGGGDGAAFALTPEGVLSLVAGKDFEAPDDADGDGTYEVTVAVAVPATVMAGAQTVNAALLVTLANANEAPVAVASASPAKVREGAEVTLDGSASADPDADDTLTYEWMQADDGAPRVVLSDANAAEVVFTSPADLAAETELGFKLKVTDAAGLHAEATVTVTVTLVSEVSIAAASGYAAEGADAVFRLTRAGSARAALTVPVTVEETGAMLGADVPASATFAAGVREASLRVPTAADAVAENDSRVTMRLGSGPGWQLAPGAAAASLTVLDDDVAPSVSAADVTVWSADMTVVEYGPRSIGAGTADLFSNQQGRAGLRAKRLWYDPTERKVRIGFDDGLDDAELLTLHMGAVSVGFPANSGGDSSFTLENVDVSWTDGETLAVRVSKPSAVALSTDATLASLSVDGATLSPAFDAGVLVYRAVADAETQTVTLAATASDAGAALAYGPGGDADTALADHQVAVPDAGETLVEVTVTAADGTVRRYRVVVARGATDAAGANTAPAGLPEISGTAQVGEVLTASAAAITDADGTENATFAWQWLAHDGADDSEIAGATDAAYEAAPADAGKTLRVRATFTDDKGTEETLVSAATETVAARAPDAPGGLAASTAEGREGELSVSWTAPESDGGSEVTGYRVQWKSGTEAYDGSEASTRQALVNDPAIVSHTVTGLTVGTAYTVRVLAVNAAGAGAAAEVEATVQDRVVPALASASVDGTILTLTYNEALDAASQPAAEAFAVSVEGTGRTVDAVALSGSAAELTLASAVASGETVTVGYTVPTGADAAPLQDAAGNDAASFTDEAVTNDTPEPENAAPAGLPEISGTAQVGETLTASADAISDADGTENATFAWQWLAHDGTDDSEIAGATNAAYEVAAEDAGKTLKVRVTFTDDKGTEEVLTSAATDTVVDRRPVAATLSVGAGAAEAGRFRVRIAFGDAVTGLALADVTASRVGGGAAAVTALAEAETGRAWTAWVAADAGRYTVRLAAGAAQAGERRSLAAVLAVDVDAAGNATAVAGPVVTSVGLATASDGTWTDGETLGLSLTFSEPVTVTTGGGTPTVGIALDGTARQASYASGSGRVAVFTYAVTADDGTVSAAALTASSLAMNGGTIRDAAGRDADLEHPGLGEATDETETESAAVLTGLKLVDTGTGTETALADGAALVLDDPANGSWGLAASVAPEAQVGSVRLVLTGGNTGIVATDDAAPYSLYGDEDGTVKGAGLPAGSYTLKATAYRQAAGAGAELGTLSVSFTVAASAPLDPDALTASFEGVPEAHGGPGWEAFTFRVRFSQEPRVSYAVLRDESFAVTGGDVRRARRVDGRNDLREIHVEPEGWDDVRVTLAGGRACGTAGAVCTADGKVLANTAVAVVKGPVAVSVADARVEEGPGVTLDFAVSLSRAASAPVTVQYATADGTATAGADYTAASGTLTFAAGETAKTVSVAVLDDAHDEGEETMKLVLSNPSGARIRDGEATGTIENSDAIPKAWLARFGRTVADHVVDAVGARVTAPVNGGSQVTLGGQPIPLDDAGNGPSSGGDDGNDARQSAAAADTLAAFADRMSGDGAGTGRVGWGDGGGADGAMRADSRTLSERELLLGSSFVLSLGGAQANGAGTAWTAWGRAASSRFDGEADGLVLDGDVTTFTFGADAARGRWLGGVALAHSTGEGGYRDHDDTGDPNHPGRGSGELESTLTSVHPYLRFEASERLSLWGVLGYGTGDLTLAVDAAGNRPRQSWQTDTEMRMAAAGARGVLVKAPETGGFELGLRTDAVVQRMRSEAASGSDGGNLAATESGTSRLRVMLEGSRGFALEGGGVLTPSLEVGMRQDGGDAETGTGVELGGGVSYADPATGLTVEAKARGLLAHEDADYTEWGASASVRLDPGAAGRGLSLSLSPAWGADSGNAERLWGHADARGLAANDGFEPAGRLDAEAGWGFGAFGGRGLATPFAGLALSQAGERTWRSGVRWTLGPELTFGVEGALREAANDNAGEREIGFSLTARF